ncbi:MAG: 3-phosphoglycerate dehydrogenase [Lachnospiraceae bacterium]|nr:3-phosphoglycerate dehydrogenase [Lachnospiraceae bacterium]
MTKYNCLNPISEKGLELLTDDYVKVDNYAECEAALVRSADMHELDVPAKLLAVARAGAGVNNIPLEKLAEAGVVVFNTPGANANGVKELVFTHMFLASRGIVDGINWVASQAGDDGLAKAQEKQKKAYAGTEITGKKLGVVGLGAIGVMVANDALKLGMHVCGYDPFLSDKAKATLSSEVEICVDLKAMCAVCDFITIHVPLMPTTKGMISKEIIDSMKENAVIINCARDTLVDEVAVVAALESGKLGKYCSDFANSTTAGRKGCIVTPHLGASTEEAEDNCAIMAVNQIKDYIENGNVENSVNFPSANLGTTKGNRLSILTKGIDSNHVVAALGKAGIRVVTQAGGVKGEYGYFLFDCADTLSVQAVKAIEETYGVSRVRVL